ncbi:MAG TPA: hypothetical protein VIL01_11030 [Thermomicrobiales bacterium]
MGAIDEDGERSRGRVGGDRCLAGEQRRAGDRDEWLGPRQEMGERVGAAGDVDVADDEDGAQEQDEADGGLGT